MTAPTRGERNKATGQAGEELAADYLKRLGYELLGRNYRCRGGEVDIVARDGATLVFVEVKTRRSTAFGLPQQAVTQFKQRQIARAAQTWLAQHRKHGTSARFDVLSVLLLPDRPAEIEHITNAFDLPH